MDLQYEQLSELPFWRRIRAARAISKVVCAEAANDKMKQVTPRQLLARKFAMLALDGNRIAGHVSVEGCVVGALYVDPDYRGNHIATTLVSAATDFVVAQQLQPIAYCNETSIKSFENCGYTESLLSDKPNRTKMLGPVSASLVQNKLCKAFASVAIAA